MVPLPSVKKNLDERATIHLHGTIGGVVSMLVTQKSKRSFKRKAETALKQEFGLPTH